MSPWPSDPLSRAAFPHQGELVMVYLLICISCGLAGNGTLTDRDTCRLAAAAYPDRVACVASAEA